MHKPVKVRRLGRKISPVFIVNDTRLQPYAEIFHFEGENMSQKPLGTIFGIFKINDTGVSSAYVVNFLTSALRKEYFSNPRRVPAASLESALNKVNIALSELAKQGNVGWLGNLELAVCVLENENLHFSISGNGFILLSRNDTLTEISRGLAPADETPNPLRTFTDLSSGRVRQDDRVIICTRELLDLFPPVTLQRESSRFAPDDFARFVHTALVNEFDLAGAILIDFFEEKEPAVAGRRQTAQDRSETTEESKNYFSQDAFRARSNAAETMRSNPEIQESDAESGSDSGYTDKKTGHIYIQQTTGAPQATGMTFFQKNYPVWKERVLEIIESIGIVLSAQWRRMKKIVSDSLSRLILEAKNRIEESRKRRTEKTANEEVVNSESGFRTENPPYESAHDRPVDRLRFINDRPVSPLSERSHARSAFLAFWDSVRGSSTSIMKTLLPNLGKIHTLFRSLGTKQKVVALVILAVIMFAPLLFSRIGDDKPVQQQNPPAVTEVLTEEQKRQAKYSQEKNLSFTPVSTLKFISSDANSQTLKVVALNKGFALVGKKNITIITDAEKKSFPLPDGIEAFQEQASYMADLDFLLLPVESGKMLVFSPSNRKFFENEVDFGDSPSRFLFTTYMTYLYALNKEKSTITRYPRSGENGFGEGSQWLKEDFELGNVTGFAGDGMLYLANGDTILKFFKNRNEPFSPEKTIVPIRFDRVSTMNDSDTLAVLDQQQNRIVEYAKGGSLVRQYILEGDDKASDIANGKGTIAILFASGKLALLTRPEN